MEKISRILPPSRRITATDIESSQPVRPGAPAYGRPTVQKPIEIQDRVSLSSLANNRSAEAQPVTYKNTKEGARAKAVEEIAERFFNPRTVADEGESTLAEETLKSIRQKESYKNVAFNND